MDTRVTQLLGTRFPIVMRAGPGPWLEAAAGISKAGGLGLVPASAAAGAQNLFRDVEQCRRVTRMPVGVSLDLRELMASTPYDAWLAALTHAGVRVLELSGPLSRSFIEKCKRQDLRVIHRCSRVREALMAERQGVDAISARIAGGDAADGENLGGWGECVAEAAATLRIPLLAEGQFARGSALAAALALGAEGVCLDAPPLSVFKMDNWPLMIESMVNDCSDSLRAALVRAGLGSVAGPPA